MSDFKPDYQGIGDMLCAPFIEAELYRRGERVAAVAFADAPVYEKGPHPGRYKAAFRVTSGVRRGRSRRAFARVINDAPEAFFTEMGTKNNPRHRTLGRALDAAGG